jgi:cobalt-precorrin 5A hydrolase
MRLAIFTVTNKGARLADKLAALLLQDDVIVYAKNGRTTNLSHHTYEQLSTLIEAVFALYDGLIFIMATGIVVRLIAAHIQDKRFDPAVVVVDDGGLFAISLLSGHLGGANDLARQVAGVLGATPVITTATDVAHKPAADVLAVKLNLAIEPFDQLKTLNAAIVNEDRVFFCIDHQLSQVELYIEQAKELGVNLDTMEKLKDSADYDSAVVITDKDLYMIQPYLYLRPATLVVGIGCRRDTPSTLIFEALSQACRKIGRSMKSIASLATTDLKMDEIGLLAAGQQLVVPIIYYNNNQLRQCIMEHQLAESEFVKKALGVGNVCEAAALLGAENHTLLLPKTKYPQVTIAIAEAKSLSLA